ncbi:hypothetical protein HGM15179_018303 [Zosterops borbonicus]|uniref:Uncharacterized protein n=1 Tax=Zosterops borbonicus TaxID=364589 RepID=A0A8K1FZA4_9PASS|nr:hypothetical protein HGM15179_018303 [Zosterops borbonicus]
MTSEIRGNNLADQEAKDAAENGIKRIMLILTPNKEELEIPKFIEVEEKELMDLSNTSQDLMVHDMGLDSEYFVIGDTAHTLIQIEIAPMTIKGKITGLMLLARCMHPTFYLAEGQILAQAIPVPAEITADGKSPEVYWVEVVGEERPSMACNIACGSERV